MKHFNYIVCGYEVASPDEGTFETFEEAKAWAETLKFKLRQDYSVIKFDLDSGNGEEIWSTK